MGIKYNWKIPKYDTEKIDELITKYKITKNVAKVLYSRGITQKDDVLNYLIGDFDEGFDPFLIYDMEKAVNRINTAIESEEKILIYGDYDADGITSTVLIYETLTSLGADVATFIPSRFVEGYGPNKEVFENYINSGVSLIITVDNGIAAVDEINFAQSLGCDVILTDHHQIQDEIPLAFAVIHPEHPMANYPFKKLAGVGVAFKLAHALLGIYPDFLLDLVAIGTVADMVPVYSENRIFIKQGLKLLNEDTRLGLQLLLDKANHKTTIDEQTIGFVIAPRLNSIGRLADAREGIQLLTIEDFHVGKDIIEKVENYNIERKLLTEKISAEASLKLKEQTSTEIALLFDEEYHEGIVGIIASNLVEKHKKPVLVAKLKENIVKGSARSYGDFNIFEALVSLKEKFINFGGHKSAAGFTISLEHVDEIKEKLSNLYTDYLETADEKIDKEVDLLVNFEEISYQLLNELDVLKPYGNSFENVVMLSENITIFDKIKFGSEKQYLRLILGDNLSNVEAISFKDNQSFDNINKGDVVDIVYNLSKNYFNGRTKLQMQIIDLHKKDTLFFDYRKNTLNFNELDKNELKLSNSFSDSKNNFYTFNEIDNILGNYSIINLLEIPSSKEILFKVLSFNPTKINLLLNNYTPLYLTYKIDKVRLIKFFNILLKYKELPLNNKDNLIRIIDYLKTNIDSLKIMVKIMEELNLCHISENKIYLNDNYTNINLENSKTYVSMQEKFHIEKILLELPIQKINHIFKEERIN